MTDQEQIDALKAQVNCLRMRVANGIDVIVNEYPESQWDDYGYSDMRKALEATPEQCLAEHDARVIDSLVMDCESAEDIDVIGEEILVFDGAQWWTDYVDIDVDTGAHYMANETEPVKWVRLFKNGKLRE